MAQRGLRRGEVDEHVAGGEDALEPLLDHDVGGAQPGRDAGVAPERGVPDALAGAGEDDARLPVEGDDDPLAHAPAGAGHHRANPFHRRRPFSRRGPAARSAAASRSRFFSLIGHSGSRNSGSIFPMSPSAVFTGMGLVSMNIASASGRSR